MTIFFCLLISGAPVEDIPINGVITALVALTTGFIGLQVTNNGVIGRFYRPELDRNNKGVTELPEPLTWSTLTEQGPGSGTPVQLTGIDSTTEIASGAGPKQRKK
jgi:hypothetical protein